jgi:hypothetical protein
VPISNFGIIDCDSSSVLPGGNLIIAILGNPCLSAREMSLMLVSGEALFVASVALLISKSLI